MFSALLAVCVALPGGNHSGAVKDAACDLLNSQQVVPFLPCDVRYLDLSDLKGERLEKAVQVISGHVNQISRSARSVKPYRVTKTLLRVNIKDYLWKREVYESLKNVDPYFHVTLVCDKKRGAPWPGGIWKADGKYYPPGAFRIDVAPDWKKIVGAVQLHSNEEIAALIAGKITEADTSIGKLILGTQSEVPILDGVWFYQQTVADFGRKPGYHDFLAFDSQKEFEQLLGFEEAKSLKFNDLWREAVARSRVLAGRGPRRVEAFSKPGGYIWRTKDSQIRTDKRNPLRVEDDNLEFDASEQFGPLPNGFMAWGLFDFKGVRQDSAPDKVVGHQRGAAGDTKLHNCISCIECHTDAGFKSLEPWFRTLFAPPRKLESADYDTFLRLQRQYLEPLEDQIEDTRRIYTRAIFRATGFTPKEWSEESWGLWKYYLEAEVDLEYAARSLGTTPKVFQAALANIKAKTGIIDPVLATFLEPPGGTIAIDTWEEAFPIAQAYLRGFVP